MLWMEKDLTIAARKRIEEKLFKEKEGVHEENAYTKTFRRECYEETKRNEEERKRNCEENSMFKDYNNF